MTPQRGQRTRSLGSLVLYPHWDPSPVGCRMGSTGLFPKQGGHCSSSPTDPGLTCRNAMALLLKFSFNSIQRWPCGSEQVGSLLRNRWELFQTQNEMCLTKINMVINKSSYSSGLARLDLTQREREVEAQLPAGVPPHLLLLLWRPPHQHRLHSMHSWASGKSRRQGNTSFGWSRTNTISSNTAASLPLLLRDSEPQKL